jgi:hypothetical protein
MLHSELGESFKNSIRKELELFGDVFEKYHLENMGNKFGIQNASNQDVELMREYLEYLYLNKKDYTLGFRRLSDALLADSKTGSANGPVCGGLEIQNLPWFGKWKNRIFNQGLNALEICNVKIDISDIESPVFVIATKEDHISPAKTCYITTDLVSGEVEFILSESGHVMGVINPPAKNKYGFYTSDKLEKSYEEWVNKANYTKGSWWNYWAEKLKSKSGKQTAKEFKYGSEKYPVIEKAPGKYVLEKCG